MFDKNDVYNLENSQECYKHIGCLGYFGNDLNEIKLAVERKSPHTLMSVVDKGKCFKASTGTGFFNHSYELFLPIQCAI